jgi:hypothetical protein
MKAPLRDHPYLTDQGVRSWPPAWLRTSGNESTTAAGEVGILRDVKTHDPISSKCFLFIEHNGATFVGRISLDSAALCQKIVKLLKQHCGEPLHSIGELGVDLAELQESLGSAA